VGAARAHHPQSAFRIPIRADPLHLTRAAFFPISHFDFDFIPWNILRSQPASHG